MAYVCMHQPTRAVGRAARDDTGSVIPLIIGFLVISLAMTALVVDVGYLRSKHLMLLGVAEQVAAAGAEGVASAATSSEFDGRPGERLMLDMRDVRALASAKVTEFATDWRNLRLASVLVRDRAAVVKVCADLRLPMSVSLPVQEPGNHASSVHTMCVSAAAALALSVPQ